MAFNRKHTIEEKELLRQKALGNKHASGYRFTEEQKAKIKGRYKGKKLSEETRKKMSLAQIGNKKMLGKKHKKETIEKMAQANLGAKNPAWLGGISKEPYTIDWTNTLRRSIRERDFYTCQVCKEPQGDKALSIHHIDYIKTNCNPDNLISLCTSCHIKTNHKREYWKEYFLTKQYA